MIREPYVRWCESLGRVTSPGYSIFHPLRSLTEVEYLHPRVIQWEATDRAGALTLVPGALRLLFNNLNKSEVGFYGHFDSVEAGVRRL